MIPKTVSARQIEKMVGAIDPFIVRVTTKELYEHTSFPEGMRSISLALTLSNPQETFTLEQAGEIQQRIIHTLKDAGYELRLI
jgi:phenylalanyl-tRNA synthetase beta subunit